MGWMDQFLANLMQVMGPRAKNGNSLCLYVLADIIICAVAYHRTQEKNELYLSLLSWEHVHDMLS